jgi:hypothetical protein
MTALQCANGATNCKRLHKKEKSCKSYNLTRLKPFDFLITSIYCCRLGSKFHRSNYFFASMLRIQLYRQQPKHLMTQLFPAKEF